MYSPTVAVLSSLVYTLVACLNGTDLKYYHFDELGSTLFLTDASGIQTDKYVYNAWGKVVSSSGSTVNPYKYVGRLGYYSDALTGLYMLGTRFYDPEAGLFTQRDAAKDGLSYYAYTSGKVMTAVDPWGKWSRCDVIEALDRTNSQYGISGVMSMNYALKYIGMMQGLDISNAEEQNFVACMGTRNNSHDSPCAKMCARESKNKDYNAIVLVPGKITLDWTTISKIFEERCYCENLVVCMARNFNLNTSKNKKIFDDVRNTCKMIGHVLWGDKYKPDHI